MNDLRPSASFCFGREELRTELVEATLAYGAALLFGGRKSGKRTFVRWLADSWSTPSISIASSGAFNLAVMMDLEESGHLKSADEFFGSLRNALRDELQVRTRRAWRAPGQASREGYTASQAFASWIDDVIRTMPNLTPNIVFVVHKAERLFDWSFDEQFRRNLLTIVRGRSYPNGARVALLMSGGFRLFALCDDDGGSCFGSIARRYALRNLAESDVENMLPAAGFSGSNTDRKKLAGFIHKEFGGQPALTREAVQRITSSGKACPALNALKKHAAQVVQNNEQLFESWRQELSDDAKLVLELLRTRTRVTEREIGGRLSGGAYKAIRAKMECCFSGIAIKERNGDLLRVVPGFWERIEAPQFQSIPSGSPLKNDRETEVITKLVVHREKPLIEVNGTKFDNLSLSQYALIFTMAERFTLDVISRLNKNEGVFQTTVIAATRTNLKKLIAGNWKCTVREKSASQQSGEWRQLPSGLRTKLKKTPNGELLLQLLPATQAKKNWVLNIKSEAVTFVPSKTA